MANANAVVPQLEVPSQEQSTSNEALQLDMYGRDAAERTVELNSHVAAAANAVVDDESIDQVLASLKAEFEGGQVDTFYDAIGYIVYRGIAEIKRQRDAAVAAKAVKRNEEQRKLYAALLKLNPALVTDPTFVAKMVAALGMTASQ